MTTQFLLGAVNVSALFTISSLSTQYIYEFFAGVIDYWSVKSTGKPATAVCLPHNKHVRGVAQCTVHQAYGLPPKTHTTASTPDQANAHSSSGLEFLNPS